MRSTFIGTVVVIVAISVFLAGCDNKDAALPAKATTVPDKLNWSDKNEYLWDGESPKSCPENVVCITKEADYIEACKRAKSVALEALPFLASMRTPVDRALANGGTVDTSTIEWTDVNGGFCFVKLSLSGLYQGTSARSLLSGNAVRFRVDKSGNIVVTGFYFPSR